MPAKPRFKDHIGVHVVPGEAVYLISERQTAVVQGAVAERVVPLLDGHRDIDELLDLIGDDCPPEQVFLLLERLAQSGQLTWAESSGAAPHTAYWEMAGAVDGTASAGAAARVQPVMLTERVSVTDLRAALDAEGIAADTGSPDCLAVVICDDYLDAELARIDGDMRAAGRPWLLARPTGSVIWAGPVFRPDEGGCWHCLAHPLRGHHHVSQYLRHAAADGTFRAAHHPALPSTVGIGLRLVALATAKWVRGLHGDNDIVLFDSITMETSRHRLRARPQCPACGDPRSAAEAASRPVRLMSRLRSRTADGGHRAREAEDILDELSYLISPVSGVVSELRPVTDCPRFARSYVAGHNFATGARNLAELRLGLRSQSNGKGMTAAQARASAFFEAVERYCGVYQGNEPARHASYQDLGEDAIHPNSCQLYSDQQFRDRARWNQEWDHFQHVPEPFDESAEMSWTSVWSMTEQRHVFLPTRYLYYYCPPEVGPPVCRADSNGNASGAYLEDAILQGFFELVERDSVAIWWYHRFRQPGVDLDSFHDQWIDSVRQGYADLRRSLWVLDVTADLGIPAVVAVSGRTDRPVEDILLGFGADFDPRIAVIRALAELNQFLPAVAQVTPDGRGYTVWEGDAYRWWRNARMADHPYLIPDPAQPPRTARCWPDSSGHDLHQDVLTAQRLIEQAGMRMLVLDQTRLDVGIPVVKVIVPGMRHFWARYAPGRLYDVPVAMGWLSSPTQEHELNPVPMFV